MSKRQTMWLLVLLLAGLGAGWAQTDSGQQPSDSGQQPSAGAAPGFAQGNSSAQVNENPPVSGLDQASLEPGLAPRSFLLPSIRVSESIDSNTSGEPGAAGVGSVTRVLGSLALQKLWKRASMDLDYGGGVAYYNNRSISTFGLTALDGDYKVLWKTGQITFRDSVSYQPEGSFGDGSYGGVGGYPPGPAGYLGGGGFGGRNFFGTGQFGSLGQARHVTNLSVVDIVEELTPRSAMTLAGGYGLVHYSGANPEGLVDSRQITAQGGYDYRLSKRDQIAVGYGFQRFNYPDVEGEGFSTHVGNLMWGHQISARMNLVLGAGPQLTITNNPTTGSHNELSATGRASLNYRFPKTSLGLSYEHFDTSGSGFFLGAKSDIVGFSVSRPLGRMWGAGLNLGYTHNSQIQKSSFGVSASSYNYGFAGFSLNRQLGRYVGAFVAYQFNELAFDSSFCGTSAECGRISQRHVATFGLDLRPRPIRLD